ncbi:MAG: universal stress protein [Bacteroidetes bacterium]|nr:MAG: universal stress protein [Bacteroidota bacterium]
MKQIVVPVDFSSCAENALKFALEIARETGAELTMVHAQFLEVNASYANLGANPDAREIRGIIIERFDRLRKELLEKNVDFEGRLNYEVRLGPITQEILDTADELKADLVVMGTHGSTGFLDKILFGSNTSEVIEQSKVPIMVIPEKANYEGFKQIVFAADYHDLQHENSLKILLEMARIWDSEVNFVSVKDGSDYGGDRATEEVNFDQLLADIPHHFKVIKDKQVIHVLENYARKKHAQLLVTMPQKHSFLAGLFHTSVSKELALRARMPLLCLPDK